MAIEQRKANQVKVTELALEADPDAKIKERLLEMGARVECE